MKLTGFDLNLLLVFDAMMQERQTSKAGQRIGMSQPAVSKALSRLRYHLKDDLFIRSPRGMSPTPLAQQMYGEVRAALQKLDAVLNPTAFDPATSDWVFRVVVNEYIASTFWPRLTAIIRDRAPNVDLRLLPSVGRGFEQLDQYQADFIISPLPDVPDRFETAALHEDGFLLIMRANHPLATGEMSLTRYAEALHLMVSIRGDDRSFVDDILSNHGLSRRVAMTINTFSTGPRIVAETDLIMTVPARLADEVIGRGDLVARQLPAEINNQPSNIKLAWHKGLATHSAHDWFRALMLEEFR
ncbi:MAG: LysR family transcriptional regulator [Pseudomonadota bacterium]